MILSSLIAAVDLDDIVQIVIAALVVLGSLFGGVAKAVRDAKSRREGVEVLIDEEESSIPVPTPMEAPRPVAQPIAPPVTKPAPHIRDVPPIFVPSRPTLPPPPPMIPPVRPTVRRRALQTVPEAAAERPARKPASQSKPSVRASSARKVKSREPSAEETHLRVGESLSKPHDESASRVPSLPVLDLSSPQALRQAVILREILGPPLSLRTSDDRIG